MRMTALLLAATMILPGCVTASKQPTAKLMNTRWVLEAFVSMDDAQGKLVPAQDQTFTLAFGTDGRAAMQIDCNRGTATYSASEGDDMNGRLNFGPVAATRAMCANPRIGDLMTSQLPNVVSYTIDAGKLSLALKMDGGIFVFTPQS